MAAPADWASGGRERDFFAVSQQADCSLLVFTGGNHSDMINYGQYVQYRNDVEDGGEEDGER